MTTRPTRLGPLLVLLSLIAAATGCRPSVEVKLSPLTAIPADDGRWPDAKAVVISDDSHLVDIASHDTSYAEWRVHRIIRLRSPDALKLADLRFELRKSREMGEFRARSITADGTVHNVGSEALKSAPVEAGDEKIARVFVASIPGAEVGGIIEYSYIIRDDYPLHAWHTDYRRLTDISGLPIRRARMKVSVNKFIRYSVRVSGSREKIRRTQEGSIRHLEWAATDIEPPPDERWAPKTEGWPRFLFKVKAIQTKSWKRAMNESWEDVLRQRISTLHGKPPRLYADYTPPTLPACPEGETRCLIEGALAVARERAAFDGLVGAFSKVRPLDKVLTERTANQYEKVVLVGRLLADAGVAVQYAFGVRTVSARLDRDYPYARVLNHMLLYLPKQPGLATPMWLDPACEHCAPGQLSDYSHGANMFMARFTVPAVGADKVEVTSRKAGGERAMPNRVHNAFEVSLSADGGIDVRLEETREGLRAAWFARDLRRWTEEQRRESAEARVADLDRRARLIEAPAPTCDRAAGRCTRILRFSVPGFGTPDGDDLLVPLSLLHGSGDFSLLRAKRTRPLVLTSSRIYRETLVMKLPPGFQHVDGPQPFEAVSDAFDTRFDVASTPGEVRVERRAARRQGRYGTQAHAPRVAALARATEARNTPLRLRRISAPSAAPEPSATPPE